MLQPTTHIELSFLTSSIWLEASEAFSVKLLGLALPGFPFFSQSTVCLVVVISEAGAEICITLILKMSFDIHGRERLFVSKNNWVRAQDRGLYTP